MIMRRIKNKLVIINTVILLFATATSYSQKAYIPPVVGSSGYNYITASSNMGPSYGLSYVPKNIDDNSLFTWWSPLPNDRETCWIKISFDNERLIDNIQIHGGAHYPNYANLGNVYFLNLRVNSANLTFSDGTSRYINLDDVDQIQTIYFPRKYSSYVIVRPSSYYASYKWNDPCISYIKFGN